MVHRIVVHVEISHRFLTEVTAWGRRIWVTGHLCFWEDEYGPTQRSFHWFAHANSSEVRPTVFPFRKTWGDRTFCRVTSLLRQALFRWASATHGLAF